MKSMNLQQPIEQASSQVAPLWPLANFVAVNPFLGFSDRTFSQTAHYLSQVMGAEMTMPLSWYAEKFSNGSIGREDLVAAIQRAPLEVKQSFEEAELPFAVESVIRKLREGESEPSEQYRPGAFSTYLDAREGTHWRNCIREEVAKWCAAYYDRGQSSWHLPGKEENFYAAWRASVRYDRNLTFAGLRGAHRTLAAMPEDPSDAIEEALAIMEVPEDLITEWLYRVFLNLPGWAGHLRYRDREKELKGEKGSELVQLLAILVNYERLLYGRYTRDENCLLGWKRSLMEEPVELANEALTLNMALRILCQQALEHGSELMLKHAVRAGSGSFEQTERPEVQAAFCIDVRSELFRRNLENTLPGVQTIGFAGFFGVPLRHRSFGQITEEARCPALLAPPVASCEHSDHCGADETDPRRIERTWKNFRVGAASCFSFVETLGLGYAWKLLKSAFGLEERNSEGSFTPGLAQELDLKTKVALATNILRGLTLTDTCAPLILLCGHGSATKNNPYASGLDCGACGGHPGDANARIAAAILNEEQVREALAGNGIVVPEDTVFIAGLHNTTTDEVVLFDESTVPASHRKQLELLRVGLDQAGLLTVALRAKTLNSSEKNIVESVRSRSRDWSQVRPEWGLARNAGFIIAPRRWTKSSDLRGKAFLHEYDPSRDPEGSVLESIIAGPLVVGTWINLQYYASATDNTHFGSGHKAIHNVVGGLGVALGNENDLRPGLPLQSLHDGKKLIHEPARLHALVAADTEIIDSILDRHPEVEALVCNGWFHLFSLGADGKDFIRRRGDGSWEHPRKLGAMS